MRPRRRELERRGEIVSLGAWRSPGAGLAVGSSEGGPAPDFDAPTVEAVEPITNPPEIILTAGAGVLLEEGDHVIHQIDDNLNFTSPDEIDDTISAGEAGDGELAPAFDLAGGTYYYRAKHQKGAEESGWSNTLELEVPEGTIAMSQGVSIIGNGIVASPNFSIVQGAGTNYVVKANNGDLYWVYIDANDDVAFVKSTDDGETWGAPVTVFTGTAVALSIWFDRWSGIAAGLIHCAYTESLTDDTLYRSIDTESADALGTETSIFAGSTTAVGGALSICRARGGNLYCKTMIDAGAEGGFFRSVDAGANWTSRTDSEALATTDQWILMPGWAADNQDMMMFFWDASADEISRCLYDDSGDSWAETSIATSMVDFPAGANTQWPNFAAAVDIANSQNLLIAWTATDLLNADLLAWKVTESAITALTDVVTNSVDDQGFAALGIDTVTGDLYAYYMGAADGTDGFPSSMTLRYKKSTDDGATWGSAVVVLPRLSVQGLWMTPRFATDKVVIVHSTGPYLTAIYERS